MQSERLSIGGLVEEDEALYCELFTDAVTMRHIGPPLTRAGAKQRFHGALASSRRQPPTELLFSIRETAAAAHIGICALQNIDRARSRAEVGVMLRPACHRRGFGTEALRLVLTTAFAVLSIDEVWGQFDPSHVAVERMNIRAGMTYYGAAPDYGARPGMRVQRAVRPGVGGQAATERGRSVIRSSGQ